MDRIYQPVNFTDLALSVDSNVKLVNIKEDIQIEVKQYLPVEDKYDLISTVLQNSYENGHYHPLKVNTFFHLYLVYLYTNIQFTDAQKEEPAKLFDMLESNGVIDAVVMGMDEHEFKLIFTMLESEIKYATEYNKTITALVHKFIDDMPLNAEKAKEIIEHFNPEDFKQVLMMAQQANGGRPIE